MGWGKPQKTSSFSTTFSNGKTTNTKTGVKLGAGWGAPGTFKGVAKTVADAPKFTPAPSPFDAAYEEGKSTLGLNRDNALAAIAKQRTQTSQDFGFNKDGTENTLDPFSRLANLKADYQKIKRGSSASYAARGLGYDGSYQNKVNDNFDGNLRNTDNLKKDFAAANTALDNQELSVNSGYNTDLSGLKWTKTQADAQDISSGNKDVGAPVNTRRDAVLSALSKTLTPKHRKALQAEARKNGWIA